MQIYLQWGTVSDQYCDHLTVGISIMIWAKTLLASFQRSNSLILLYESLGRLMLKNKMLAVIVIIVTAALGGGIMTFAIGLPGSPCAGITGTTRNFTIVASINGFNDSVNHQQESWPII